VKKHLPTIIVIVMLLIGFALLFYPDFSSAWNARIQAGLLDQYEIDVAAMELEIIEDHFQRAEAVNAELSRLPPDAPLLIAHVAPVPEDYHQILNVRGTMAQLEIPRINVNLPIQHTTSHAVLDRAVGHLEGTAFPIGGYGTHSVLTAHSGLATARLFTDLEGNVTYGDYFFINVLNRRLAYRVDQILTVYPHEIESLRVDPNSDFVTLITCTPYAVNTHRLLVRGYRVPYVVDMAEEIVTEMTPNSVDMRVYIFLAFFALFMLVFIIYQIIVGTREKKRPAMPAKPQPHQPYVSPTPIEPIIVPVNPAAADFEIPLYTTEEPIASPPPPTVSYHDPVTNIINDSRYDSIVSETTDPRFTHPAENKFSKTQSGSLLSQYMAKGAATVASPRVTTAATTPPSHQFKQPKPLLSKSSGQYGRSSGTQSVLSNIKSKGVIIGVCTSVLVLAIVIGILFIFNSSSAVSHEEAIASFVNRVEEYRASHDERLVAEMVANWENSGEFGLNEDALSEEPFARLMQRINEYNQHLYQVGQPNLPDPFQYSQSSFNLNYFGMDEEMIGFMTIPSINIELPIFMGASRENLHQGLAHLTQTSLPIGGESTNAVIAGHPEIGRTQILNGVTQLSLGDEIRITNFYETLIYTIVDITQIHPLQTEAFIIQNGRDLVTLLAYQENSQQRYMVVAERSR